METQSEGLKTYLNPDGSLRLIEWATAANRMGYKNALYISDEARPVKMAHSPATGLGLVTNGLLGADIIRLEAGTGFVPHVHPGDHLLIVLAGEGTITYNGKIYPTWAGTIYMVEGSIPHAVGAVTDHVIMAIGSPHKAVDDTERMTPVEYQNIIAEVGDLHCLICDTRAVYPVRLHEVGCPHCPCDKCNPYD